MSIMDVLSERTNKSENSKIMYGVSVAIVTNINDPEKLGRVKCKLVSEPDEKDATDWIKVATFMSGKERGAFFLPEVGDEVLLSFDNGDIHRPYVVGCLWSKTESPAPHKIDGDKNDIRKIKSRAGNELIFKDKDGEVGMELHTPKERKISLDDKNEAIIIGDKDSKNVMKIESSGGNITIVAATKLTLEAGKCKIVMDGNSNTITIECPGKLEEKGNQVNIEATGMMSIKSSGMLDVKSDAVVNIKGNMVKIN